MTPADFKLGQEVYLRYSEGRKHKDTDDLVSLYVSKVGRKWVELAVTPDRLNRHYRFDPVTMDVDGEGFSSAGRVYLTRDDYMAAKCRSEAWVNLRNGVSRGYSAPEHLTLADIEAMQAILTGEG